MSGRRELSFGPALLLFLGGPVIWIAHFMVVYLLGEVLCTGLGGVGRVLGLPTISFVTLVLTVPAVLATALVTRRAWRARGGEHGDLAFVGFLLGALSMIAILFDGLMPAFLTGC